MEGFDTMFAGVRNSPAHRIRRRRRIVRPLVDALTAGAVFVMFTIVSCHAPLSARTSPAMFAGVEHSATPDAVKALAPATRPPVIEIATTPFSTSPNAVYGRTSLSAAWSLLGVALSVLAALNLTLFRHLRRAYAPRRRTSVRK